MSIPNLASTLAEWLTYIESVHPAAIELGLDRVRAVAQRLAIHLGAIVITVGGTNGKGSTCAMLEAILRAANYRVALYTSPHLLHFNERARIEGQPLSDACLIENFAAVEAARETVLLTYFEFTTLAILRAFMQQPQDVVILEVGLGGRLDAVNIIDPDCAILTGVALDHTEWLGPTREAIGIEKAHIFRTGRPAIYGEPNPPQTVVDYAHQMGADLWLSGRDFAFRGDSQQWHYTGRAQNRHAIAYPALRGVNQLLNAASALAALEALRKRLVIPQQAVRQGLMQVELPGRFQRIPGEPSLILDVAHNPQAAGVLAQNLDSSGFYPATHAVVGMLVEKDHAGVLMPLLSRVDHWYCATLPGPRGMSAGALASVLTQMLETHRKTLAISQTSATPSIECFDSPALALQASQKGAQANDRIVVFGSFLTVAAVLS